MTRSERDEGRAGYERQIREISLEALKARSQVREEMPHPSRDARREAVKAHANYLDVLKKHAGEDALDEGWQDRLPFDPDAMLATSVEIEREVASRNPNATESATVQAATQVPADVILDLGRELNAVAKELGFAAEVAESTHRTEITDELIEEVDEWRKQNLES